MKVLITGGAGYIGSTIAACCTDNGITPVILDDYSKGLREFARPYANYEGDIADTALIRRILSEHPDIDAVIHCAAKSWSRNPYPHHWPTTKTMSLSLLRYYASSQPSASAGSSSAQPHPCTKPAMTTWSTSPQQSPRKALIRHRNGCWNASCVTSPPPAT